MEEGSSELDMTTQLPAPDNITSVTKDLFNLYSLSCQCKSKDISERRIRLDFGLVAEVRSPFDLIATFFCLWKPLYAVAGP